MAITDKDVSIQLPLERLIETVCKLSSEDLMEVRRRIEAQLQTSYQIEDASHDLEDKEFWASDLGQEMMAEADSSITMEEVLKITSKIKGSMAKMISEERDER
ncbi:MAG: hypothetical protein ACI8V2_000125 [Candidatus Latescibacterota bacterium]|jgi:hypothetical protein